MTKQFILVVGVVVLSVGTAVPQNPVKQSLPQPNWNVKYDSGSLHLQPGQWLKIAFIPRASLSDIAAPLFSVRADQLVKVEYSAKSEKASHLMQGPRSGCSYAHHLMPDAVNHPRPELTVAVAFSPGPVSRFAERLNAKRPVRFVWKNGDEQNSVVVKVTECEYQSFIANAQWLVGSHWAEVSRDSGR